MTQPFTVIIPARNEAVNLVMTAPALRKALTDLPATVLYVLNATTDRSAEIIDRVFEGEALIIDLPAPGKPAALNAGDGVARTGTVVYLDADCTVAPDMFPLLLRPIEDGLADLVAPRLKVDTANAGLIAGSVGRVWADQMSRRMDAFMGCTGFSAAGRRKRGPWRRLLADDDWARGRIAASRRLVVEEARVGMSAPRSLNAWLTVRGRWIRGRRELVRSGEAAPDYVRVPPRGTPLDLAVYYAVRLLAEPVAIWQRLRCDGWGRDESTRKAHDARL